MGEVDITTSSGARVQDTALDNLGPLQNKPIKNKRGWEPERVSKPRRLLYS